MQCRSGMFPISIPPQWHEEQMPIYSANVLKQILIWNLEGTIAEK